MMNAAGGIVGLGIKVLDFFGIDVAGAAAHKFGAELELKLLKSDGPGWYRCPLDKNFGLSKVPAGQVVAVDQGPILVFLHGTASCTEGSFGKLWDPANREGQSARQRLSRFAGDCAVHLSI